MMTMSPEKIAELRKLRGCGLISAVGEYTPDELWEALDEIERLRAELARCGGDNCMGRRCDDVTNWVTEQAAKARVAAERERWGTLLSAARRISEGNAKRADDCGMLSRALLDALSVLRA